FFDQGGVQVVIMELVHLEHSLSQLKITMKSGQVFMHVADQVVVHFLRDIIVVEGTFQSVGVIADAAIKNILLEISVKLRSEGAFKIGLFPHESFKHQFTVFADGRSPVEGKVGVIERDRLTIRQLGGGVGKIGVGKNAVDGRGVARHQRSLCDDLFYLIASFVRPLADKIIEIEIKIFQ